MFLPYNTFRIRVVFDFVFLNTFHTCVGIVIDVELAAVMYMSISLLSM